MQTFLPYFNFVKAARCLDNKRLGKQRVEAKQILEILLGKESKWYNHPAVRMWGGYKELLAIYMNTMIKEWISRGFKNSLPLIYFKSKIKIPYWFGDKRIVISHRSNLLRKNFNHYSKFGWKVPLYLKYYWPTHGGDLGSTDAMRQRDGIL